MSSIYFTFIYSYLSFSWIIFKVQENPLSLSHTLFLSSVNVWCFQSQWVIVLNNHDLNINNNKCDYAICPNSEALRNRIIFYFKCCSNFLTVRKGFFMLKEKLESPTKSPHRLLLHSHKLMPVFLEYNVQMSHMGVRFSWSHCVSINVDIQGKTRGNKLGER